MDQSLMTAPSIRVGRLVTLAGEPSKTTEKAQPAPLDVLEYGKPVRQHVREFGAVFGVIFLIIAGYQELRLGRTGVASAWLAAAVVIAALGYLLPGFLRPLWKAWMGLAHVLGTIMTSLLLFIVWAVMLIPMALFLKGIGKSVMEMGFKVPQTSSYWEPKKKESNNFKLLDRQF